MKNITSQMKNARPNVEEVVDLMVLAVCVERPAYRYVPYWRTYLRSLLLSNCPTAVSDKVFKGVCVKVPPSARTRHLSKSSDASPKMPTIIDEKMPEST